MRTEKEIRFQRLAVDHAVRKLVDECQKKWVAGQLETSLVVEILSLPGIIFNTLNWVLGDSSGREIKNVISGAENISRCLKTGARLPQPSQEKIFSMLDEISKETARLHKIILKDRKELLEVDWNSLESKE